MDILETTYNYFLRTVFGIANPVKKSIIKTQCKVHKAINIYALKILKNDKYFKEYNFFNSYIQDINEGAVWTDQDFKSSNHFYNPYKKRGLYGRKNAMDLGVDYYYKATELWTKGEFNKSLFYLGAALHIVQDMTIPQHANIRLLDNHHQYEVYVNRTYEYLDKLEVEKGTLLLESIEDYIRFNARVAIKIYKKFNMISKDEERFYRIARCGIPLAKRTTAGAMVMFYNNIFK
ncbi:Phospholipase C zinc-binding protein [[Clostridium] ultunense Esp]|uniref:Phospholipase C n=1 Tax=[Clostridium] ultunense Esp TaxID=1288971 RepID=M1Z6A0_9FIRM|nr:zinc dependent phospholipase C family protein [Schnuerera ultunensis]CCQ93108.1 Phospholipase C zinc-binding protein [[Clostridium] ultunense Esp]SHD77894.1 Phospholipase C zinc-binding protein [[Clostridium] ultunense Esp]